MNYTQEELEEFAKGMKRVSDIVMSRGPDFIFAPVTGSVPFVDILAIVNRKFPIDLAEYPPNSSRFPNRTELMDRWYSAFFADNYSGEKMHIVCLDEVLSGSSASVGHTQFRKALEALALKKAKEGGGNGDLFEKLQRKYAKDIDYHIVGIAEREPRNKNFSRLVNEGIATVVDFSNVPTIDNVELNPVRLKLIGRTPDDNGIYAPEIEKMEYTKEYLQLLQDVAKYVGVNPSNVTPVNTGKIAESLSRCRRG
jgi:hypothetical protein